MSVNNKFNPITYTSQNDLNNLFNKIMNHLILNLKNLSYNNKIMNH